MFKDMKKEKILSIIIFVIILLIPLIYSFFYLKSYWNPYGNLSDMKIAVVNLDEGKDGNNQGAEFVKSLKESDTFEIHEVSEAEAEEGMKKGDYYATIKVPNNFTECLKSASSEDKQIATVTYSPNQATNYLATQIVNSAVKTIQLNLQSKVDKEIIAELSGKLNEVPNSLQTISDGADTILNGAESLDSGIKQISDGTNQLSNSYSQFNTGVQSAYSGSETLQNGINQVASGVGTLQSGSQKLDSAVDQINSGIDSMSANGAESVTALATGINTLNNNASTLNNYATQGANSSKNLATDVNIYVGTVNAMETELQGLLNKSTDSTISIEEVKKVLNKYNTTLSTKASIATASKNLAQNDAYTSAYASGVYGGTTELLSKSGGLTQMFQGIQGLKSALAEVKKGTASLKNGTVALATGTSNLATGSANLTAGLEKLNSSSNQIDGAIKTINTGVSSASTGSTQLVSGVQTFKTSINEGLAETKEQLKSLNGIDEFGETPINFETKEYGKVDSYGIAFTPLFLCIGLWVGALMAYVVLYYDHDERFGILGMSNKNKLLQNIIYIAIGAIEGLITGILLKAGLGYTVENIALYYGVSILIGITFMSIIQFLIRNFGDIGKFLALIILVLQLAAAGGTFPIETIDKGFQAISPYLPMTYAIKLLREILVPTATNFKANYIGILIAISVILFIITEIVDIIKNKKVVEDK